VLEVQDNLLHVKISRSVEANKHRSLTFPFTIGSRVCLTTLHRCNEYKAKGEKCVAKFMPHYDGPYSTSPGLRLSISSPLARLWARP
jgi:hypothetical protein